MIKELKKKVENLTESLIAWRRAGRSFYTPSAIWPISRIILPAVAGTYRRRHPEHSVFYRVFFYYFERFLREYETAGSSDGSRGEWGIFLKASLDVFSDSREKFN